MKTYLVPTIVLLLSLAFLDPFMVLMPEMLFYALTVVFFVLFVSYAALVWNEDVQDEREEVHRAFAGRVAYLSGAAVLFLGIIYQALVNHSVDQWLVGALLVMVLAKTISLCYIQREG